MAFYKFKTRPQISGISNWLNDPTFSDCVVTSIIDQKEFKLHRNVLAEASELFKTKLTTDMKEATTNTIHLFDDSKVLKNLFTMLYTGEFKGTLKDIMDLHVAATKYLIHKIRVWCVTKLYYLANVDNAAEILSYGHKYELKAMKNRALILIGRNFEKIRTSNQFELLLKDRDLMDMALTAFISRINEKKLKI